MGRTEKLLLLAGSTVVVGAASFMTGRSLAPKALETRKKPFTATMVETRYHEGKTQPVYTEYYLFAVRGDGAQVRVFRRESPAHEWMEPKVIVDFAARKLVSVNPFAESVSTYSIGDGVVSVYPSQPKDACSNTNLERSIFVGFEVCKVRKELAGMAGVETSGEFLMAPALDCFALREEVTSGPVAGSKHRTVREALFVIAGEPAASLFQIPSNYVERSPGEAAGVFERRYPQQRYSSEQGREVLDGVYYRTQQPK